MDVFGAATNFVLDLEKELAWSNNVNLKGYTMSSQPEGWLLIVRAERGGRRVVCFSNGLLQIDCWRQLYYDMHKKPGIKWKADKFWKGG